MGRKYVQVLRLESVLKSVLEAGNVRNARDDPFRFDKIVWSINFRHSSNPPRTSSISISVTTTNFNIKKSLSYIAKVTLNPLANDELAWWINNLELSNGRPIIKSLLQILLQTDALGCSAPRDENRGPVVKEGTRMSYLFSGTSSHKVAFIDLQQNDDVQFSAYSSRQVNGPGLPFQNGENKESATSNTFERDMGIPFQTSDHNYGRVPPRSTESSERLGIKKPERYHGVEIMSTNFQKYLS